MNVSRVLFDSEAGYLQAERGMELPHVYVNISNVGDSTISYSPSHFKLRDGRGNVTGPRFALGLDGQLGSGQLTPKGSVSGWLVFQTARGDRNLLLTFDPCLILCAKIEIPLQAGR